MLNRFAGLLVALLLASPPLLAQPTWPRDAKGSFYLRGQLPWHRADSTAACRQKALESWAAKLTGSPIQYILSPESQRDQRIKLSLGSFVGPGSYSKQRGYSYVEITYSLQLTATATGLRYQFHTFEISHLNGDVGITWPLEDYPKKQDSFQTGKAFRQWLRATLATW